MVDKRLVGSGLLLLVGIAGFVVSIQAGKDAFADHVTGAAYRGAHSGGGAVSFRVSDDGRLILDFQMTNVKGDTCGPLDYDERSSNSLSPAGGTPSAGFTPRAPMNGNGPALAGSPPAGLALGGTPPTGLPQSAFPIGNGTSTFGTPPAGFAPGYPAGGGAAQAIEIQSHQFSRTSGSQIHGTFKASGVAEGTFRLSIQVPKSGGGSTVCNSETLTWSATTAAIAVTKAATGTTTVATLAAATTNRPAQWFDRPATSIGATAGCPSNGQWLLLYWGGNDGATNHAAAAACANTDVYWVQRSGRWLGYKPSLAVASDQWTLYHGEAYLVHRS